MDEAAFTDRVNAARAMAVAVGFDAPASRLFYCPKVSRPERDAGSEPLPRRPLDLFPNANRPGRRPAPAATRTRRSSRSP